MAARLTTFRDLIESLVDGVGGIALDQNHTRLKRAVNEACRDLFAIHKWRYATREYRNYLNASQSSSTITYTNSSRELTLASGSWPTMTEPQNWSVRIADNTYRVYARTSNSALTLHPTLNPGADVAAGTAYTLFQNAYDLPDDFGGMHGFYSASTLASFYVSPADWHWLERSSGTNATPFYWTILPSSQSPGKYTLRLAGYPSTAKPIFFLYRQQATDLKWAGFETAATTGTVSITSGSATIAGSSTTFDSTMEGRIIRIGDATNIPTNNDGLYPFSEELRIKTVASATSATAFTNASQSLSTKKYCISDLVDIAPPMINALIAGVEWKLERGLKEKEIREQAFYRAVRRAMEQDSMSLDMAQAWGGAMDGWVFHELIFNPQD